MSVKNVSDCLMLIVDGHLDLAYNALFHRRDLTQPVPVLREREDPLAGHKPGGPHPDALRKRPRADAGRGTPTVSLPQMRSGGVGIVLSTIMSRVQVPNSALGDGMRTQAAAHAMGQAHLHYYKALEDEGELSFIHTTQDLERLVDLWKHPTSETPIGLVLSMESADPILGPDDVAGWAAAGLRSVSLTHFGINTWGHGTGTKGGLYPCAYPLLEALRAAGVALDLTHAADVTFWQLLDAWDGPVHASHCNCRALVPGQRHLSDEMIKAIIERDGVIGLVFAEPMLNPTWDFDDPANFPSPTAQRPMAAVVDHIDHICQLAGNVNHVAFGTDLDGGFGREWAPTDYDTISDLSRFLSILQQRGYDASGVEAIAHGNLLRFLRRILPTGSSA